MYTLFPLSYFPFCKMYDNELQSAHYKHLSPVWLSPTCLLVNLFNKYYICKPSSFDFGVALRISQQVERLSSPPQNASKYVHNFLIGKNRLFYPRFSTIRNYNNLQRLLLVFLDNALSQSDLNTNLLLRSRLWTVWILRHMYLNQVKLSYLRLMVVLSYFSCNKLTDLSILSESFG